MFSKSASIAEPNKTSVETGSDSRRSLGVSQGFDMTIMN